MRVNENRRRICEGEVATDFQLERLLNDQELQDLARHLNMTLHAFGTKIFIAGESGRIIGSTVEATLQCTLTDLASVRSYLDGL